MATRRSSTTASIEIQYEDFHPNFQWKEDEASNILLVHLPGFEKEQMKITYVHSSRQIRVTGEQPISNNKWRRFNEAFPVPQNCNVQKIQAKFQSPTLTITLPKITPSILPPQQDANFNQEKQTDTKKPQSPKIMPQMTQSHEPPSTITDDQKKKKKKEDEAEREKALFEEEEDSKKRKESLMEGQTPPPPNEELNNKKIRKEEEKMDQNGSKQVKKRVMEIISEDKQSLVNIGVAILVIAALGAYISYTYGSSPSSND